MATNSPGSIDSDSFWRICRAPTCRVTLIASTRPPPGASDAWLDEGVPNGLMIGGSNVNSVMICNLRDPWTCLVRP